MELKIPTTSDERVQFIGDMLTVITRKCDSNVNYLRMVKDENNMNEKLFKQLSYVESDFTEIDKIVLKIVEALQMEKN